MVRSTEFGLNLWASTKPPDLYELMESSKQDLIVCLNRSHIADIEVLLGRCNLPTADCREQLQNFTGIIEGDKLIVVGAVQYHAPVALLRSIAVHPEFRGRGLAAIMTNYLLEKLKSHNVNEIYLLTETAVSYFERFGFSVIERQAVADYIKTTRQFEFLCPTTAQAMRLDL
jgi:N-acetylglutamate synthase-like GNAT family acetyltransferase